MILLNRPYHKQTLIDLYDKSSLVVCADGAINRLYDSFNDDIERQGYIPDVVIGDFDSIRPEC